MKKYLWAFYAKYKKMVYYLYDKGSRARKVVEKRRMKDFVVIFKKINKLLKKFKNDVSLMANSLMAKAVNYMINQWKTLENVLRCGRAEISNNLAEQRMKAVKLNLKNCQNIGSEEAAKNAAFMLSLTESCSLNGINAIDYLKHLLECIRDNSKQDKIQLLPCFYKGKC